MLKKLSFIPGIVVAVSVVTGAYIFGSDMPSASATTGPNLGVSTPGGYSATPKYTNSKTALGGGVPNVRGTSSSPNKQLLAEGKTLYIQACQSCHGTQGQGTTRGVYLKGRGAAAINFWLTTGRMPAAKPQIESPRKPPVFDPQQINALVAYVTSFGGGGPAIPKVNLSNTKLSTGARLFIDNCASCHTAAGSGAALSYGTYAPDLHMATKTQIAEAIRTGPLQMPVFGPKTLSKSDVNNIVRYVLYLRHPASPGGLPIGSVGPTAEGYVGILGGLGVLILVSYWIGERA